METKQEPDLESEPVSITIQENIGIELFTQDEKRYDDREDNLISTDIDRLNLNNDNEFHFFYKMQDSINTNALNFNDMYVKSNSPMASNCNSDVEIDIDSHQENEYANSSPFIRKLMRREDDNRRNEVVKTHKFVSEDYYDTESQFIRHHSDHKKYKKFTYNDIEKSLSQYYQKTDNNLSETDLLITYLSGMRAIYVISRNITQMKSYSVSMSTISVAICLAVIAPFVKDLYWGAYLISAGNALVAILISLSRYLKFDSNSAQYAFMAKQFNKLETKVEFEHSKHSSSSQTLDVESTIMEMNEYIQEFIPTEVVQLFPLIYSTNIIKFIRQIELYRKNLIIRFRDIKNEIHYILYKLNSAGEDVKTLTILPRRIREKNRILHLMELKEQTKQDLILCKNTYTQIDELFNKEIRYAETHQSCFGCAGWFRPNYDFSKLNPVVQDYLKLVIPD